MANPGSPDKWPLHQSGCVLYSMLPTERNDAVINGKRFQLPVGITCTSELPRPDAFILTLSIVAGSCTKHNQ